MLISRVTEFRDMSDVERQNMKGAVLNAVLATPVAAYAEELAAFYQMTHRLLHGKFVRLCWLVFL